jgi:hypothetical protein
MLSRTIALASLWAVFCGVRIAAAAGTTMPSFDQVQKLVEKQLGTLADYRPGDIISQQQVAPIFDQLQRLGWTVRDRAEILQLVPGENEFIVRQLRSPEGRTFMRQSNKYPLSFDRIDRLSQMDMGEKNVKAIIRGPDGYKLIQYMTSTPYGRNMGQMLSQDPHGADFNSPTGRLYTADAFLARLQQSYDAEIAASR